MWAVGNKGGFLKVFDRMNMPWSGVSVKSTGPEGLPVIYHGGKMVNGNLAQYIDPVTGATSFIFEYEPGQDGGPALLCFREFPPPTTGPPAPENSPTSTAQSAMGQASGSGQ
jgi:hypothetical protein